MILAIYVGTLWGWMGRNKGLLDCVIKWLTSDLNWFIMGLFNTKWSSTKMNTKDKIMKLMGRRKSGLTSYELDKRVPEVVLKTVRNALCELVKVGKLEHDDYKYLHNDRYVTAYRIIT